MSGEKHLATLISSMQARLDDREFVFVTLPQGNMQDVAALSPLSTFREAEGLSAVLLKATADEQGISYSGTFKCITLNIHSSLDAVGLTAAVSTKLTQAKISANVIAAYYHDHIFVAACDAQKALNTLNDLSKTGA
ncbi:ACT domain-containing protein [Glaciecola siphonariae]|uniref:ACT domain-containing protein n=1 Tax=Glaciecola siphonariae TaxID=521012 RepID=A0ABV9LUW9_9ALTE